MQWVSSATKNNNSTEGVSKPEFMTREYGKTTGERASRVRDACSFELWTSLFADDCVLLFQSRDDLIRGSSHTFSRVSKNAGGRPRLASVAFDGRYMGLAL